MNASLDPIVLLMERGAPGFEHDVFWMKVCDLLVCAILSTHSSYTPVLLSCWLFFFILWGSQNTHLCDWKLLCAHFLHDTYPALLAMHNNISCDICLDISVYSRIQWGWISNARNLKDLIVWSIYEVLRRA